MIVALALAGVSGMWCCRRRSEEKDDDATQIRGLQNLGNTCYFNSTVQALAHTNSVFRKELENLHKKEEFVLSVLEFFNAMQPGNSIPYSPDNLHSMFGKKSAKFADYRQHDSHECLRNFLDNVRKEERDSSGALDKRKVLTVVDSVFGGHFMTVYICKECETPYHVCEALLDISLPIMIDEKDLAAMNSARGSNRKESRTVKLQTPKTQIKHYASQTDDSTERKINKSPIDIKPTAVEDAIETEQNFRLDVALQQNTSDQTFQFKPKTATTGRHSTNINAQPLTSVYEVDVGVTSNEPAEALSIQEEDSLETEKLNILNNMVNVAPTNVELENLSGGKIVETFKDNSLTNPRMVDTDTKSETFSFDDKDKDAEESKTTFGTESDLGEVCQAKEPDASEVDNEISDEEKEFRDVSYSEKLDENVENSCSSTKAEGHLAQKNDTSNNPNPPERSIPVGTEDNKESEDHEWTKSDARDNKTEIQECSERQQQSSEEQQHKEREEHQYGGQQHSHHTQLVQEQCNTGEKVGGQHSHQTEFVKEEHNTGAKSANEQQDRQHIRNTEPKKVGEENKVEQEEHVQRVEEQEQQQELEAEKRKEHETVQGQEQNEQDEEQAPQMEDTENDEEDDKEEDEEENDELQNPKQDQKLEEQHVAKHVLNDQPERQNKGAEEQQGGQHVSNAKLEGEVGKEQPKQEVEEQKQLEASEDDEEDEEQQQEENVQEHQEQDRETAPRKDDSKNGDEEKEDEDEKDGGVEGREKQEQEQDIDQAPEKGDGEDDVEEVEDKEETEGKDAAEKHKEEDEKDNVVDKEKEVDEKQNLQQKQVLGESDFEVKEYASETRDLYRETVEKLMTPLSFSSPYLPNKETAISKHVTIDNCLMYFTREEYIHKEYLCNPCYAKHLEKGGEDVLLTSATKQTMIFNPPAILTLHLKRFELKPGESVKRTDMITYGELLDIAPYCSSMCLRNDPPCQNIWYSLYGVVVHIGSTLKSGHYVAYVKIKDNNAGLKKFLQEKYFDRDLTMEQLIEMMQEKQQRQTPKQPGETPQQPGGTWYCMNDSRFHKVPVAEVLNQEAYLLFYERKS